MNKLERDNAREKIEERIFHIKLKTTQNEVNIEKNSNFAKVIEQEYATKYLESLGVEATPKNVQQILKNYPLKQCQITAGWNSSGLYVDTITIIVREKKKFRETPQNSLQKEVNQEIIKELDLKKMNNIQQNVPNEIEQQKELLEKEEEKKIKFKLSFAIEDIKAKYLFPYNQTYQRKQNIFMQNHDRLEFQQNDDTHSEHDKFLIFESKLFQLPFIHIEIQSSLLKDVQRPPNIMPEEIEKVTKQVAKLFPKHIFPLKGSGKYIWFTQAIIDKVFDMVESQEMVKLIGLFVHLSYWLVFGVTQPIQIQSLTKKQIYISMMEIVEYFQSLFNQKMWMHIAMPMVLLTIKMSSEYLYKNHYPIFFEKPRVDTNSPDNIAMDKIFFFADRLFDQNNLYCRFLFLESNFQNNHKVGSDAKFIHKRIFGVSPYLDVLIHNPQNSRTRAIVAKQRDIDIRDKVLTIGEKKSTSLMPPIVRNYVQEDKSRLEQAQKAKLFNIVLSRMDQDLENVLKQKQVLQLKS